VLIRPAAVRDAEALTDLHLDVWEETYGDLIAVDILQERRKSRSDRIARWRQNIPQPESETLLAWEDDRSRLLGFVSTGPGRDEPEAGLPDVEVWALYARAEVYGRGVGYALLNEAIGTAAAYLWVLDGNDRAIGFYERQGFRFDGSSKTEPVGVERRMVRRSVTAT
jgi:GNAT superfamily N-acetyltransferase